MTMSHSLVRTFILPNPHDFHAPLSSYTTEQLLKSSEGGYFGPGNAQLPAPPMLMMDRITEISTDGGEFSRGHVIAELDITPDLWFFHCHFRGDPVMPGCLGLDALWQIIGYWLGWSGSPGKGRAVGVGEVKFKGHVTPDIALVRYRVDMRQVRRGKLALGIANGRVFADDACVYLASDMRVGLIAPAS
jgi:3-hydroxyacyl-[acyl-carrier protein] dehydratase / trans-2-decenoyl-[acyl-carrier protein] isomerase